MNHSRKRVIPPYLIASAIVIVLSILTVYPISLLQFLEAKTYDWRFQLRGARATGGEVAIVAIDEKAISERGRWPWDRETTAGLVKAVSELGPKVIAIDIVFSEPDQNGAMKMIGELKEGVTEDGYGKRLLLMEKPVDSDTLLAETLQGVGNVVLPLVFLVPKRWEGMKEGAEPSYIRTAEFPFTKPGSFFEPYTASQVLPPLNVLAKSSAAMGSIYTAYDIDGTIRREPLGIKFKKGYYPSFGLEAARLFLDVPKDKEALYSGDGIGLGERFIRTDESGKALINYAGPAGTFPVYSAADILSGKVSADKLKDKVVVIGTTAIGTYDVHVTPYANMPEVEKQASVIECIIHNNFIERYKTQWLMVVGFMLFSGVVLVTALQRMRALGGAALSAVFFAAYLYTAYALFAYKGYWLDFITPSLAIFFLYSSVTGYRHMTEERKVREIKEIFSSYVTEKVFDELVRNPEMAKLGGARKEVTILFSDIKGFTGISETKEPEEVVSLLNEYLKTMTEVVFRWDGTLDKFIGDGVMVFWGAPTEQENHAELAVRCAIDMISSLKRLRSKWMWEGKVPLDIGIGINTGEVIVGNMGAEGKKMDYTVIGDPVNLASRAETLTRSYNAHIIITEFTYRRAKEMFNQQIGHIAVSELDKVKVKGREEPVTVYGVEPVD
ncbi:MAG: adenylate/guanylate cyclase domain-containing protein [Deltaproteobacteria bacterium]|nr:adenylate/guanylate cyclase domain-containing protein [Deltaproteobacteria bacterium]